MEIKNTNNQELLKVSALIYGNSGNGKTYSASTLKGKTLIIALDPGLLTLREFDIESIQPKSWNELLEVYKMLKTEEFEKKYDNIFFDGITDANEFCKQHILFEERPKVKGTISKIYDDILTLADYGLLQTKMQRLITSFIGLPYNIFFTALEDSRKDEKTGAETVCPSLNGKLAHNVLAYFDFCFRLIIKTTGDESERFFLCKSTEKSLCKDRSGKLDRLELPDWSSVIAKIKN